MKKIFIILSAMLFFSIGCKDPHGGGHSGPTGEMDTEMGEFLIEGKKYDVGKDYSFSYSFSRKPAIGMLVIKIELIDKAGNSDSSLKITGDSGMPSMKGAHDSGEVEFKLNKKGYYLLPVNVVMPGKWEVRIKFYKGNRSIKEARIGFDV